MMGNLVTRSNPATPNSVFYVSTPKQQRSPPPVPTASTPYRPQEQIDQCYDDQDANPFAYSPAQPVRSKRPESYELNESNVAKNVSTRTPSSQSQNGSSEEVPLLGGERIEAVYNDVTYMCPYNSAASHKGVLTITNYKLYFVAKNCHEGSPVTIDVPFGLIRRVEKIGGQRTSGGENGYGIALHCNDIRNLRFALNKTEGHPRKNILDTLRIFSFPLSHSCPLFAYQFTDRYPDECDGWKVYIPLEEFKRQGVPNKSWRITNINESFEFCESYPKLLGVPATISDDELLEVGKYRSKSRIPVLSWIHPATTATICRSSQPLVGLRSHRSEMDEKYIQAIMEANPQSERLFIMDARPKVNALANIPVGGGYESEKLYENVELVFLDIQNIHVMRDSLKKVRDICFPVIDSSKWLSNIESTQWLYHLNTILVGVVKVVDKIENEKTSVLVHCADGWDRTSQLTSLAMLLLDPYYRTLKGFMVLVEREWLSLGHKFGQRIGHGEDKHNDSDRSPIFLQFIDCVWQITNQFPYSFEFSEHFLTFVLDHLYSCLFGTFLYNNEKERDINQVRKYTQSLWSFVNHKRDIFLNKMYKDPNCRGDQKSQSVTNYHGDQKSSRSVLFPATELQFLKLWTGYYCRWNARMRPPQV